jgi:cellulose synthase/poly-beta-1,6-N-acetylglucosamine synthase-like glycosyltransferase
MADRTIITRQPGRAGHRDTLRATHTTPIIPCTKDSHPQPTLPKQPNHHLPRYHSHQMISVLILTYNEQRDLPDCLASVSWSDDIHVFDSHSTDATIEIAKAAGAHIHTRTFDDYATHRNVALATIPFKYPWVFLPDADERPTPELSR